jgi:hypothetical protein
LTTRKSHKARGANFETDLRDYFRRIGFDSERLARTGARDEGDVVVRQNFLGRIGIIEAKAQVNQVALTYLVGRKRLRLKQRIIQRQEGFKEHPSYQRWLSRQEENQ